MYYRRTLKKLFLGEGGHVSRPALPYKSSTPSSARLLSISRLTLGHAPLLANTWQELRIIVIVDGTSCTGPS